MDVSAASYPTLFNLSTERGRELDQMSITDWIKASCPAGCQSKLGQLLDVAYNIEYGAETSVQSSLNMLYLLGYAGQGQLRIFGKSNEKYHVRGGNDQITRASPTPSRARSRRGGADRDQARTRTAPTALPSAGAPARHRGPRRARAALLDPAHGRLLEGRLLGS